MKRNGILLLLILKGVLRELFRFGFSLWRIAQIFALRTAVQLLEIRNDEVNFANHNILTVIMGASASSRSLPSSSCQVDVPNTFCDEKTLIASDKLQQNHALQLVLNDEVIADSFENFLEDTKAEKLLFVKYFAELERLKSLCLTMPNGNKKSCDNDLTIQDMILNNSIKIYLLFHPSKISHKKQIEGQISECLSPLLSHTTALPEPSFGETCYEMLTSCQTSLLIYLTEELRVFVKSQQYFLRHLASRIPAQRAICKQILINVQASDCVNYNNKLTNSAEENDDNCTTTEDSLASSCSASQ